uniref:Uncharacterized protein n=1 Tax=Sinocyclocheilus grahami TaxID=75366 RepID=A0A672LMZ7_SINGR
IPDWGSKLCGREFIRAVVYTCGGSRWRRFSSPQDMEGEFAIAEIHANYGYIMCQMLVSVLGFRANLIGL